MLKYIVVFFALLTTSVLADDPIMPDPKLTPGATFQVSINQIAEPGYSAGVRHVTAKQKEEAFARYGVHPIKTGDYEIDHLISLELGGSNDDANLWPQSYKTLPWNAHKKDVLENRLHHLVVERQIPLEQAQSEIATNWIAAYKKYVGSK